MSRLHLEKAVQPETSELCVQLGTAVDNLQFAASELSKSERYPGKRAHEIFIHACAFAEVHREIIAPLAHHFFYERFHLWCVEVAAIPGRLDPRETVGQPKRDWIVLHAEHAITGDASMLLQTSPNLAASRNQKRLEPKI